MENSDPSKLSILSLLTSANRQLTNNGTDSSPKLNNYLSNFLVGLFDFKLPEPTGRRPLTIETFILNVCLPNLLSYVMAYLVLVPGTQLLRLAILPVLLWRLFKGATTLDLSMGYDELGLAYLNHGLVLAFTGLAMRNIIWALETRPYRRIVSQSRGVAAKQDSQFQSVGPYPFLDAFELVFNTRGLGWDWSRGLHVPPEWRCTSSRTKFTLQTLASLVFNFVVFDLCYYGAQYLSPTPSGPHVGRTIYEQGLTLHQQFIQSSAIVFLFGFAVLAYMQSIYDSSTLVGINVFRQDPTSWPPLFEAPWFSTSLTEVWSKRWHQLIRYSFIRLGAKPFGILFGRPGGVVGAFLVSAILHDLGVWAMGNGNEFATVGGFFLLMAMSTIMETTWTKITGRKVGGVLGWLWVMVVFIVCGHSFIDAWARKGMFESVMLPPAFRPSFWIFGPLPV